MASKDHEDKVDPMWSADIDDRRVAIAKLASAGARKALAAARMVLPPVSQQSAAR